MTAGVLHESVTMPMPVGGGIVVLAVAVVIGAERPPRRRAEAGLGRTT